jgi:hypothetical protein
MARWIVQRKKGNFYASNFIDYQDGVIILQLPSIKHKSKSNQNHPMALAFPSKGTTNSSSAARILAKHIDLTRH